MARPQRRTPTAMTGLEKDRVAGGGGRSDEELFALLERLSLQMSSQGRLLQECCNCCRERSRCLKKGLPRAASAPAKRAPVTNRGTAVWVPGEVPEKAKSKAKIKGKAERKGEKQRRSSKSLEDKAPSPRPPRARAALLSSVPQLRATVEVRPRRRATPKSNAKRTPSEAPAPVPAAAVPAEPSAPEAKLRGRRSSRNLLAELAGPLPLEPRKLEPVTFEQFDPPARKLNAAVPEPAREIFYGSPEKPGERCQGCGRTFTEDSIYCRHCGRKRSSPTLSQEGPNLSAVRLGSAPSVPTQPGPEPLNLDSATRQLEQLVQETHQALVRDGIINGENEPTVPSAATPNLDAVDRALEELQRGLLEIDHVLAKPMPDAAI